MLFLPMTLYVLSLASHSLNAMATPSALPESYSFESNEVVHHLGYKTTIKASIILQQPEPQSIGSIVFNQNKSTKYGYISRLEIDKGHRNQRLGSLLLTYACDYLQKKGCPYVYLVAVPPEKKDFKRLIAFYEQHGFRRDQNEPIAPEEDCFGQIMCKYLRPNLEEEIAITVLYQELPFFNE